MKKTPLTKLFDDNRFLMVFSIVVAAFCWVAVTVINNPDGRSVISDVEVNLALQADAIADRGLSAIVEGELFTRVTVRGPRISVGKLRPEDISVTVRLSDDITERNTYNLELVLAEPLGDGIIVESFNPSTVEVRFDRMATVTLDIETDIRGISVPPDYLIHQTRVSPATVTVTAPQEDIDRIHRAVVRTDLEEELTGTYATELEIQLLDTQGEEISTESRHLTMDSPTAQVAIQILKTKTLPLVINFTNVPEDFPLNALEGLMYWTDEEITVAGPADLIDNHQELRLGIINLRELTAENNVFYYEVSLPSDSFINVNNILDVTVEFDTERWTSATYNVQEIYPFNEPARYDVNILTNQVRVSVMGDADALEALTADDIVVMADFADQVLEPGQRSYPVKISIPGKGLVWAVGEYTITIQVSEAEQESED